MHSVKLLMLKLNSSQVYIHLKKQAGKMQQKKSKHQINSNERKAEMKNAQNFMQQTSKR